MANEGNIDVVPNAKHIRYQRFDRLRKQSRFIRWIEAQAEKFETAPQSVRDTLREIGPFYPSDIADQPPPLAGVVSVALLGAGTSWTSTGSAGEITNAGATLVTTGFLVDMRVALDAGGPTFSPGDFLPRDTGIITVLTETQMDITLDGGGPPRSGSSQVGDVIRISEIAEG